jgi:uncharacterized membrane protein YebE (DUF533 family)
MTTSAEKVLFFQRNQYLDQLTEALIMIDKLKEHINTLEKDKEDATEG